MNSFFVKNLEPILLVSLLAGLLIYSFFSKSIGPIIIFIAIVGALISAVYFSRPAIVKRKMSKIEKKKILDCQTGDYVKVEGKVKYIENPILAPFSSRPCAYYYVKVEEKQEGPRMDMDRNPQDRPLRRWYKIIEEEYGSNLVITDGNNYALIETENIKSTLIADKKYKPWKLDNALDQLNKYLEKRFPDFTKILNSSHTIRYKEGIIKEGDNIAVAGKMTWKKRSELKLDIPVDRILVISPINEKPVYLNNELDSPKSNWYMDGAF